MGAREPIPVYSSAQVAAITKHWEKKIQSMSQPTKGQDMLDLEAIEKRHAAGSPAAEDIGDLIAEVKRLQPKTKSALPSVASGVPLPDDSKMDHTLKPKGS